MLFSLQAAELGWETVEKRSEILGLNIFHKIHKFETRPLVRKCMPKSDINRERIVKPNATQFNSKQL